MLPAATPSAGAPGSSRWQGTVEKVLGPGRVAPTPGGQLSVCTLPSKATATHAPNPHLEATPASPLKSSQQAQLTGPRGRVALAPGTP